MYTTYDNALVAIMFYYVPVHNRYIMIMVNTHLNM